VSGRAEVYVSAWSAGVAIGSPVPVSISGGSHPVWTKTGRSMVWNDPKGTLQRADVREENALRVSAPEPWLQQAAPKASDQFAAFDLLADGRALFVEKGQDEDDISRYNVVLNWFDELERRAGAPARVHG
jgi:hypothetical protein